MKQSFWNNVPFVRILLPFIAGITISIYFHCNFLYSLAALAISFVAFLVAFFFFKKFRYAVFNGILLSSTLFCFGLSLNQFQNELNSSIHFSKQYEAKYLTVYIDEVPVEKVKSLKFHTHVIGYFDSLSEQHLCNGNLLLYAAKDTLSKSLKYGDVLLVKNNLVRKIPPPQNPDEFNYKRYLHFNNVHYQAYVKHNDFVKTQATKANKLFLFVYGAQTYFSNVLTEFIINPTEIAVAQALLYGYDDAIDPEVVQAYANTGTLHVLAVSGMHVGLIFMILGLLLKFMDRTNRMKFWKHVIIIICLWIYSMLCGLSPSILRATVMFSFIILAKMVNRPSNIFNTLAISAFSLLCYDTNIIANVGFQLSYMAVIGIVFLQPYVYDWYDATTKLGNEIWKITSVSIAAQLTTFPLGLLYFHQFPNYFLFSNLIIIPLTTIIIYIGIVLIVFSKITFIAIWLGKLMYLGIALTNAIVKFVEKMPFSYVNGIHISIVQAVIIFISISFFITYFLKQQSFYFKTALAFACVFFVLNDIKSVEDKSRIEIVVYHVGGFTAVNFINGKSCLLLADTAFVRDESKFHFHLQQHLWHCGIKQPEIKLLNNDWQKIIFGEKNIYVSGKDLPQFAIHEKQIDVLVIRDKMNLKNLLEMAKINQVVFSASLKPHVSEAMKKLLDEKNIPYTDVGVSGAFELSL
ncbi:MAG: ComEC/Rec2 family competence protein [Bacteroidota bacterium]